MIDTKILHPFLKDYLISMGAVFTSHNKYHCLFKENHKREDNNPSAILYRTGMYCKCFACGEGGDIIDVCMKLESLTFIDAIKKLCIQFNIKLPDDLSRKKKQSNILEDIYSELIKEKNYSGLRRRKLPDSFLNYGIGSVDYKKVVNIGNKYSDKDKLNSGLWIKRYGKLKLMQIFGNDITTITIKNINNEVVSFTGRNYKYQLKYIDASSNIYGNKEVMFPISYALNYMKRKREVIITEGYFDALYLHSIGKRNALAIRCASITDSQLQILKEAFGNRFNITFMLDNDETGSTNTLKILLDKYTNINTRFYDINLFVYRYDMKYKDPGEMQSISKSEFKKYVKKESGICYLLKDYKLDISDDLMIKKLIDISAKNINSSIDIDIYSKILSDRFKMNYNNIKKELLKQWAQVSYLI